jgi:hypothetical protein
VRARTRSIPPQDIDLSYAAWLGRAGLPFSLVFTKADKRKKGQPRHTANVTAFKRALLAQQGFAVLPPSLVTSAAAGAGKQELLAFIASLRVMFEQHQKQAATQGKAAREQREEAAAQEGGGGVAPPQQQQQQQARQQQVRQQQQQQQQQQQARRRRA